MCSSLFDQQGRQHRCHGKLQSTFVVQQLGSRMWPPTSVPGALSSREQQLQRNKQWSRIDGALYPRMGLDMLLVGHRGCVNHVQFNDSGTEEGDLSVCLQGLLQPLLSPWMEAA